ncbi:C-X-C chemokine receptor type 1-like isoform X1 [Mytilus trossulus]|uniref:C-X-C chemokine receptor type 1-like isoform X1 n=1 Tax=Mytilus trossulus TaxID=6551 RepID=UPI0030071EB1
MEGEEDKSPGVSMIVICVVVALIGIVCILGNILVIQALICSKYPRIPIYIAIGGLAVADLLNIIMESPYIIFNEVGHKGIVNTPLCKAHFYLTSVCSYVAGAHLVLFSIIRCIMLNERVRSRSYVRHTIIGCVVIWIVICLSNILNLKTVSYDKDFKVCVERGSDLTPEDERILWLRFSFSYMIPLLVIGVLYVVTKFLSMRFFYESYSSREQRFSKMVTILVITFAIFKLPNEVVYIMIFYKTREYITTAMTLSDEDGDALYNQIDTLFEVLKYCEIVALVDLAIRPVIYAKFSYYFGNSFDEVINCNSCRERGHRPRRKKTDSGMSNHTTLIQDEGEEIDKDNLDADEDIDENAKHVDKDNNEMDVVDYFEDEVQDSKCPISIIINNEKNGGLFVGSIYDEKNGETGIRIERVSMIEKEIEKDEIIEDTFGKPA